MRRERALLTTALLALTWSCGARTPLREPSLDGGADARADGADARPLGPERCGNGIDDDGDSLVDEGCPVCIRAGTTPWQSHRGGPPVCFGRTFVRHGDPEMYRFESIPAQDAPGWGALGAASVEFTERSTLCDRPCQCLDGGDFTFFQTTVALPDGFVLRSFEVSMAAVDDGARVTIFNDRSPAGVTDPGAFAFFPSGVTARLERHLTVGLNRVVITHVDDCCSERALTGVRLLVNGGALEQCR